VKILVSMTLLTLTLAGCGCKGKGAGGPAGKGTTPPDPAACTAQQSRVRGLYAAESATAATPQDSAEATALRAQEVDDNTAMVLADCRKDPAKFAPCLASAASVAQLERDCLIPLDDQGAVEGSYFKSRP
jgi:predicted small lipoprotein YifL